MLNYVLTNSKKRDNMETTGNDFLERIKKIQTPVNDALAKYFNGSLDNSGLKLSENEVKKTQQMLNDGGFTDWKGKKLAVDGVRGKRFEDSFNKYMQSTVYDPKVETLQRALNVNGFRDKNGNQLLTDGKYGPKTDSAVMAAAEEYRNMNSSASEKSADMPDTIDDYIKNDNKSKTIGYLENIRQNSPESFDKIMNELEQNGIDINDIDSIVGSVTDNAKNADLDYDASLEHMFGGAETVAKTPNIKDIEKESNRAAKEALFKFDTEIKEMRKINENITNKLNSKGSSRADVANVLKDFGFGSSNDINNFRNGSDYSVISSYAAKNGISIDKAIDRLSDITNAKQASTVYVPIRKIAETYGNIKWDDSTKTAVTNICGESYRFAYGDGKGTYVNGNDEKMYVSVLPNKNGVGYNLPKLSDNESVNLMLYAALAERGTHETGNNFVEYNDWFYNNRVGGDDHPWCAVFVSWCANHVGILDEVVPRYENCTNAQIAYQNQNRLHLTESGYEPKAGDTFFYGNAGADHTGLVLAFDKANKMVYTIEGNIGDAVRVLKRPLSSIYSFGSNGGTTFGIIPNNTDKFTGKIV